MSYCINRAVSISSIFFLPPAFRSLFGLWRMLFFSGMRKRLQVYQIPADRVLDGSVFPGAGAAVSPG